MPALKSPLKLNTRRIFFRGIVDLEGLFRIMRKWFLDYKYEFEEKMAKYKLTREGGIKEHDWLAYKNVTEHIRFEITCKFIIKDVVGVEVIKKGEKKSLSQCKLQLEITPQVVLDPYGHFAESNLMKRLGEWLQTHIIKKDIIFIYADQLDYRALKLQGIVKEYLNFEAQENAYAAKW